MTKPWNEKEVKSFVATLKKHWDLGDAVQEHNRKHGTQRSKDAVTSALDRYGLGKVGDYLKETPKLSIEIPEDKRIKSLVDYCKYHPSSTMTDLCDHFELPPKGVLELARRAIEKNYRLDITKDRLVLNTEAPPVDRLIVHKIPVEPVKDYIVVGVASDIHIHSRLHRRECLIDFIDTCYNDYGIRTILHPGDMFAGMRMYPGQMNEVFSLAMEEQLEDAVKGLPKRDGLTYRVIGGNHDESFLKNAGADIMKALASERKDVINYGFYSALMDIGPEDGAKVKIELHHPDKAGAYAISYLLQKEIEQIPPGMKPHVLFCGHTHQSIFLPDYRGVAAFYSGTFEEQSLFLKRKHIAPHLGGWIVKFGITKSGAIKTLEPIYVRYFHARRGPIISGGERYEKSLGVPIGVE